MIGSRRPPAVTRLRCAASCPSSSVLPLGDAITPAQHAAPRRRRRWYSRKRRPRQTCLYSGGVHAAAQGVGHLPELGFVADGGGGGVRGGRVLLHFGQVLPLGGLTGATVLGAPNDYDERWSAGGNAAGKQSASIVRLALSTRIALAISVTTAPRSSSSRYIRRCKKCV